VTLCPACFNAVAAVRPAIPAPTIRMFSWTVLPLEPIVKRYQRHCARRLLTQAMLSGRSRLCCRVGDNCALASSFPYSYEVRYMEGSPSISET